MGAEASAEVVKAGEGAGDILLGGKEVGEMGGERGFAGVEGGEGGADFGGGGGFEKGGGGVVIVGGGGFRCFCRIGVAGHGCGGTDADAS